MPAELQKSLSISSAAQTIPTIQSQTIGLPVPLDFQGKMTPPPKDFNSETAAL